MSSKVWGKEKPASIEGLSLNPSLSYRIGKKPPPPFLEFMVDAQGMWHWMMLFGIKHWESAVSQWFVHTASYQMIDAQKHTNNPCLNTTSIPGTPCKTQPDVEGWVWEAGRVRGTEGPLLQGYRASTHIWSTQRWWHSFGGMLSLSLREGKKLRGRGMKGGL